MNTYEVKGGISVFATGGHQKKGPFGKTGFSKIEKNTIFQISIRSPNRDFEKTPFFSSNLPNGPLTSATVGYSIAIPMGTIPLGEFPLGNIIQAQAEERG